MAKNPTPSPEDRAVELANQSQSQSDYLAHYLPDRNAEPYSLHTLMEETGISGPRVAAKDLADQSFVILGAKPFGSSYDPDRHAYFCVIRLDSDGKIYTTVLGGAAVVEMLDILASQDFARPIAVTLRHIAGGRFGQYYTLE